MHVCLYIYTYCTWTYMYTIYIYFFYHIFVQVCLRIYIPFRKWHWGTLRFPQLVANVANEGDPSSFQKSKNFYKALLTTNEFPQIPMKLETPILICRTKSFDVLRSWRTSAWTRQSPKIGSGRITLMVLLSDVWLAWWTCCVSICQCILKSFL